MKKQSSNYIKLNGQDLDAILRGAMRYDDNYKHVYQDTGRTGTYILLDNYEIASEFSGKLEILSSFIFKQIIFNNCKINEITISNNIDELRFEKCELNRITIKSSCIVKELYIINSKSKIDEILVEGGSLEYININAEVNSILYNGASRNSSLILKGNLNGLIEKLEFFDLKQLQFEAKALIKECILVASEYPFVSQNVRIKSLKYSSNPADSISISGIFNNIEFKNAGSIDFSNLICLEDLSIQQTKSESTHLSISNTYIGRKLLIENVKATLEIKLNNIENKYVYINELEIRNELSHLSLRSISGETPIYINNLSFKNVHLTKDIYWNIQGLYCQKIFFYDFKNAGTGNITNTISGGFEPLEISYEELINQFKKAEISYLYFLDGKLNQDKVKDHFELKIQFTDLGKINFIDTDFSNFVMKFYSAKISEIFLAGSKMPRQIQAINIGRKDIDLKHQERIANSQLKKIHEQQGDMLAANEYFANEMNAYYESLNWKDFFWEKLPLFLNRLSSNHGQSWIRALVITLVFSILFYSIFIYTLGYSLKNPFSNNNFDVFLNISSFFLDFINPLHKIETFQDLNSSTDFKPSTRFIDGVGRIFIAFFVYQLIQAFRKHGRSK